MIDPKDDTVIVGKHALEQIMRERDHAVVWLKHYQENTAAVAELTTTEARLRKRITELCEKNQQLDEENHDLRQASGKYKFDERRESLQGIIDALQSLLPETKEATND